jgi:hypothetical protein
MLTVGSASVVAAAAPEAVWACLVDAAAWRDWAEGTAWVVFEGPPAAGTYATIKPLRGRQTAYRIHAAAAPSLFVLELTFGPLAALRLSWTVVPAAGGATIAATVEVGGLLAGMLVGRMAARAAAVLPANLERLGALAGEKKDAADMRPRE